MGTGKLFEAVRKNALAKPNGQKPRIAIGVTKDTEKMRSSLKDGSYYAELLVVGVPISGFSCQPVSGGAENEEEIAEALVRCANMGKVQGLVRGQIDYSVYHRALNRVYGFTRDVMCISLMRSAAGNEWLLSPMAHDHDSSISGRFYLATSAVQIYEMLGLTNPRIAVLCADNELGYMPEVDRDYYEAVEIVERLKAAKFDAHLYPVQIETAMVECDIVVPMNGILGNFVHRSLCYIGNVSLGGAFCLTRKLVSIDTSRYGDAFALPIQSAAAIVNLGGLRVSESAPSAGQT